MAYLRKNVGTVTGIATQAELDIVEADTDRLQTNLMQVAFKGAVSHTLAKYNLQDQIVDEFVTNAGVDTTASTAEILTSGVYSSSTIDGTGGTETTTGAYNVHTFLLAQSGNAFVANGTLTDVEYLVIAGGGGGGSGHRSGAGGAGGYRNSVVGETTGGGGSAETRLTLTAASYTITVGGGGAGGSTGTLQGKNGVNSVFSTITALGGGGGGLGDAGTPGTAGGSGGGGTGYAPTGGEGGAASSPTQGYAGGDGNSYVPGATFQCGGGGGGAGAVGYLGSNLGTGGDGGVGLSSAINGSGTFRGGGGGGGNYDNGNTTVGGNGGGGDGSRGPGGSGTSEAGDANTGGGAGGNGGTTSPAGAGGSGIVIIRYQPAYNNLVLQSLDTEAETQPDFADMIMLMEDNAGTATINTDIKGFISRDSGTTFTEGTLVDEGDWGTNKRILSFHDLDISAQPADKTMCYKITTHNQTGSLITKVHATSIGWR